MSLRIKTIILIVISLLVSMPVMYFCTQAMFMRNFHRLEERRAAEDVLRARAALEKEIEEFNAKIFDWSAWDDTYSFIQTHDSRFVKANLNVVTYEDLGFSVLFFIDGKGRVVYAKRYNEKENSLDPVGGRLQSDFLREGVLAKRTGVSDSLCGIVKAGGELYIVASQPVITSEKKGPVRGTMIAARRIDGREVEAISQVARLNISVSGTGDNNKTAGRNDSSPGGKPLIRYTDSHNMYGFVSVNDIFGLPVMIMKVDMPREIFREGMAGARYFYVIFLISGILTATLILILLEKFIISRTTVLNAQLGFIGRRADISERVSVSGSDELADLAAGVNNMLDRLEVSQAALTRQEALRESEEKYRRLIEFSPDGVVIVTENTVVFANETALSLFAEPDPDSMIGKPILKLINPVDRGFFKDWMHSVITYGGPNRIEYKFTRDDMIPAYVEIAGSLFEFQGKPSIQIVAHDISGRMKAEEQLRHQAFHDELTGLPNKYSLVLKLNEAVDTARESGGRVAVMLLDLNRFKDINDTMGHVFGDDVLKAVGGRLSELVRPGGFLARYSGDEFVYIMEGVQSEAGAKMAVARILSAFDTPFKVQEHEIHLGASMGISLFPDDADNPDDLVMNADMAMYRSKEMDEDKSFKFYSARIRSETSENKVLEDELRKAVNNELIRLHYQPLVDLQSRRIVGVEALSRWRHDGLGDIPPAKFIPIAERTGLIFPLGEWVLWSACSQNAEWRQRGLPRVRMAVNLSARQFHHENLPRVVNHIMTETGLSAGALELEVTESAAMRDMDGVINQINKLKSIGAEVSIDDFGTGHSSLSYLKNFPVSTMKIAGVFMRDIENDPKTASIVETIIRLAHVLGRRVVAEEVETARQLEILSGMRCDEIQGFLFSRPLPGDEVAALLEGNVVFT